MRTVPCRTDQDRLLERLSLNPLLVPLVLKVVMLLEHTATTATTIEIRQIKGQGSQISLIRRERIDMT